MSEQTFTGFEAPGTTPVSDYVFDFLLKELTGNELKVLMYIIRRTFGFGKNADAISLSQFREGMKTKDGKVLNVGCGIGHNRLILVALTSLEKKGYVVSEKREAVTGSKDTTIYKLHFKKAQEVVTSGNEVVTPSNQGGSYFSHQGVVTSGNIQETHVTRNTTKESVVVGNITPEESENTHTSFAQETTTNDTGSHGLDDNGDHPSVNPDSTLGDDPAFTPSDPETVTPTQPIQPKTLTSPSYSQNSTTLQAKPSKPLVVPILPVPLPPASTVTAMVPALPVTPSSAKPLREEPTTLARNRQAAIDRINLFHEVVGDFGDENWDFEAAWTFSQKVPSYAGIREDIEKVYRYCVDVKYKDDPRVIVGMERVWKAWAWLKQEQQASQRTLKSVVNGRPQPHKLDPNRDPWARD